MQASAFIWRQTIEKAVRVVGVFLKRTEYHLINCTLEMGGSMTFSQTLELSQVQLSPAKSALCNPSLWPTMSDEQLSSIAGQLSTEMLGKEMLQEEMSNSSLGEQQTSKSGRC